MSTAILRLPFRAIQFTQLAVREVKINWKFLYVGVAAASLVLFVYYIVIVNQLTQGAYVIKNGNKMLSRLSSQNGTLQANFAQTNFLGEVSKKAVALSFQKTTNVQYVQVLQGFVAVVK